MKSSASRKARLPAGRRGRSTRGQSRVPAPQRSILSKMRDLPPDKVMEVEDFIDFLRQRESDRQLTRSASKVAERVFSDVWDNAEDAAYDRL